MVFSFTKQERLVLLTFATVIIAGSGFRWAFKEFAFWKYLNSFIEQQNFYSTVDVNTASYEELLSVPYIGPYTAQRLIDYRKEHGAFQCLQEIKNVPGIREGNYNIFSRHLRI